MSRAVELAGSIRYQLSPGVHTAGACAQGCGKRARGAGVCADCLTDELEEIVGAPLAERFVGAVRELNTCLLLIATAESHG